MKDRDRFSTYLGFFLLSVIVGSTAVFAGLHLRKKKRIRLRWRKVGGLKNLKGEGKGDVFALVIGGILLYVGTVGDSLEDSVMEALRRRYPDRRRIPKNIKVHVGEVLNAPESIRRNVAFLLVTILQPPWNSPEEGEYSGEVPVEIQNEGEVPPGVKDVLRL